MKSANLTAIRAKFPGLAGSDVLLDNAGGAQVPLSVVDRIREYMLHSYVQLGADYETGLRASQVVEKARLFIHELMGVGDCGHVALGPSSSAMINMLADCYGRAPQGDRPEIIIAESGHESNVGPWVRLGDRGFDVRWWRVDPRQQRCTVDGLVELLSKRTRLVALPHVSNILGSVEDVVQITRLAHEQGARVVVDGVAYAPHRAMEVAEWGVDWYAFSTYKVFGPHMAALFGTHEAFAELEGPNHFFVDRRDVPYKFELGGVLHEGCAGLLGLGEYLNFLGGEAESDSSRRRTIEVAFEKMVGMERKLQRPLLEFLSTKKHVRIVGDGIDAEDRVPTISFVHDNKSSREIAQGANTAGLGVRFGHFYAHRLCSALGISPEDGVVRASLVHYNTLEEVDRLVHFLDSLL